MTNYKIIHSLPGLHNVHIIHHLQIHAGHNDSYLNLSCNKYFHFRRILSFDFIFLSTDFKAFRGNILVDYCVIKTNSLKVTFGIWQNFENSPV